MADYNKLAGVLSGQQGVLSQYAGAPKTYAQGALNFLRNIPNALFALSQGQAYGTTDPTNAVSDMERAKFWRGSVFGTPEDVQSRNLDRALAVALAAPTVYHGSPHKFDKFDSSKIGTGEGAQAYGHGMYFAETPDVAKTYAAGKTPMVKQQVMPDGRIKTVDVPRDSGSLYTVDLPDAMASKMLDWDKPLSQQAPEVQAALRPLPAPGTGFTYGDILDALNAAPHLRDAKEYSWAHPTGADIYKAHGDALMVGNKAPGQVTASQSLGKLGIPGIRYLDQGSRGAGQGTYNYVVFPGMEDALKILERK